MGISGDVSRSIVDDVVEDFLLADATLGVEFWDATNSG
jgi:hypothetical protein